MGMQEIIADEVAERVRHIFDGNYTEFQRGLDIKVARTIDGEIRLSRAAAVALVDEYMKMQQELE